MGPGGFHELKRFVWERRSPVMRMPPLRAMGLRLAVGKIILMWL